MLSNLLFFLLGVAVGFTVVFLYIKKIWKRLQRKLPEIDITKETVNAIVAGDKPTGEFIKVNQVQEYLKTHDGEIRLSDVLEDEER